MTEKIDRKGKILWFVLLLLALVAILFPIYIILKYSISDKASWVTGGKYAVPWWPFEPTLENIVYYLSDKRFWSNALMSFEIAILTVAISTIFSVPAAYVMTRYHFKGMGIILLLLMSARVIPDVAAAVPIAKVFSEGILKNLPTTLKISLTHSTFGIPYMIFVIKGIFETIPKDLDEQAYIMGASKIYTFLRIVTPLVLPGVAASGIYVFILSWNEFLYAYFITATSTGRVIPLAVYMKSLFGVSSPSPVQLSVISLIVSFPALIATLFIQKYIVGGVTEGAVK